LQWLLCRWPEGSDSSLNAMLDSLSH
jgi:hypothetical protein